MTYAKALAAKENAELAREYKMDAKVRAERTAAFCEDQILKLNPHIGVIVRKGKRMFYTGNGDNMTSNIESLLK